jgi:hypothetical protein
VVASTYLYSQVTLESGKGIEKLIKSHALKNNVINSKMEERFINPARPDEIVKELFHDNSDVLNEFSSQFSKELLEFAEVFSEAYKKHLELNHLIKNTENKQKAYVSGFTYLLLDNLLTSVKLFIMGYAIPSGNLMRQVIESVALATLCSLKDKIRISTKQNKKKDIHFYTSFINHKSEAKSFLALKYLEANYDNLGINKDAINVLKKSRIFYHGYSHPGEFSLASTMSLGKPGKVFIGASFDHAKMEAYKKELLHRINFCKTLPNLIAGLIYRVKQLP